MLTIIQSCPEITDPLPLSQFIDPPSETIEDDASEFLSNIIERYSEDLVEEVDVEELDQEAIAPIKTVKYKEALEALDMPLSLCEQQHTEGSDEILRKINAIKTVLQQRQSNRATQLLFEPGNVAALWSRARVW
jgi:hypothetical protein